MFRVRGLGVGVWGLGLKDIRGVGVLGIRGSRDIVGY